MTVTAHQLARFLSSVEAEEATLQQRLRDAEARRSRQQTASSMTAGAPAIAGVASDRTKSHSVPPQTATSGQGGEQNFVYFAHTETYDPTELEIYEEY